MELILTLYKNLGSFLKTQNSTLSLSLAQDAGPLLLKNIFLSADFSSNCFLI